MPWLPELFTAPALQRVLDERRRDSLVAVPYFDGLLAGDPDPLVESFAGAPEVLDPVRGRVKGAAAFRAFVVQAATWLREHHATVEDVEHVILDRHGFEEVVLRFETDQGARRLPVAVVADRTDDGRIEEVRVYFSSRALTGRPAGRPPLLQPDPGARVPDVVAAYLRGLAGGDVDAIAGTFEPDHPELAGLCARLVADAGPVLETCAVVDDGRACALEYNLVGRGTTRLSPLAGAAVLVRGPTGRLAAVRVYDDTDPGLGPDA